MGYVIGFGNYISFEVIGVALSFIHMHETCALTCTVNRCFEEILRQ